MRQLLLMRHAKSAPALRFGTEAEQSDHARPLNAAGHAGAAAMRAAMLEYGLSPDVILVSSPFCACCKACRTQCEVPW
jgi:phosphohistidine phosphatase SixA